MNLYRTIRASKHHNVTKIMLSTSDSPSTSSAAPQSTPRPAPAPEADHSLSTAVDNANICEVRRLIQSGTNVNDILDGQTPLYKALVGGQTLIAHILATAGAQLDPDYENAHSSDIQVWLAALHDDMIDLNHLITHHRSVNQAPAEGRGAGWSPLLLASALGHSEVEKYLITNGASLVSAPAAFNGKFALHFAASANRVDSVRCYINAHADVNALDFGRSTPLHLAAAAGATETVIFLAQNGANLDCINIRRETPLWIACQNRHFSTVQALVQHGASLDTKCRGNCMAISQSIENDDYLTMNFLIEAGASCSPAHHVSAKNASPMEQIWSKVSYRRLESVSALVLANSKGGRVDACTAPAHPLIPVPVVRDNTDPSTVFGMAAHNLVEKLKECLESGACNPNMKSKNGMTLLHWACAGDAPECVQLLLDAGAKPYETVTISDGLDKLDLPPLVFTIHDTGETNESFVNLVGHPPVKIDQDDKNGLLMWKQSVSVNYIVQMSDGARTLMHLALYANSPTCVHLLSAHGAHNTRLGALYAGISTSESPLHSALKTKPLPELAIKALFRTHPHRKVVEERIWDKLPLFFAIEECSVDAVRVLVECGVDVDDPYEDEKFEDPGCLVYAENLLKVAEKSRFYTDLGRLTPIVQFLRTTELISDQKVVLETAEATEYEYESDTEE